MTPGAHVLGDRFQFEEPTHYTISRDTGDVGEDNVSLLTRILAILNAQLEAQKEEARDAARRLEEFGVEATEAIKTQLNPRNEDFEKNALQYLLGAGAMGLLLNEFLAGLGVTSSILNTKKDEPPATPAPPGVSSSPQAKGESRSDNVPVTARQQEALQFFMNKGWTRAQAAGIVGNLMVESTEALNPKQKQIGGGGGEGLAQWTHPARKKKFKDIMGVPVLEASFQQQLEFIQWELSNTHKKAARLLREADTPEKAAEIVSDHYEQPGVPHLSRRKGYARRVFEGGQRPQRQVAASNEAPVRAPARNSATIASMALAPAAPPLLAVPMMVGAAAVDMGSSIISPPANNSTKTRQASVRPSSDIASYLLGK